ncbi:type II secretion system F family protein [Mycobacterium sp. CVI_P3]|uniref:Type II secretion system F family protein n=1 Tax=Mycobacterium pinniadriaticum TaxID=2994102 RepID=A0ABT3SJ87_9MYCO|nr:type II secretion system F family protein [Mycobacterium pinniadriaticum]MCX2933099.1 type II secretion system F family protein [Mycobacterium pinniadriaticum]MCX2939601.1 type II secretion system F family protein [Mycobacterium pinniadriaticum]
MNGISLAAVLLAIAVLAAPPPPRGRIGLATQRTGVRGPMLAACAVAAVLLPPPVLLCSAVLGMTLFARRRRRRRDQTRNQAGRALAGALETLVGELRVGAHPVRAFAIAAGESDGGIGAALRAVAARAWLGADVGAGLLAMADSTSVPAQWDRLAVCWRLAADHGLAMAALMRAAQRDIMERQRFIARVEAGLAGARATAGILAGLPLVGVLLGELIGAHPVRFLLGGGAGSVLLVTGVGLVCAGLVWADHITDRILT